MLVSFFCRAKSIQELARHCAQNFSCTIMQKAESFLYCGISFMLVVIFYPEMILWIILILNYSRHLYA